MAQAPRCYTSLPIRPTFYKDNYYLERSIAIPLLEYKEWQSSSLATATTLIQESRDPRELQSKLLSWAHSLHQEAAQHG